MIGVPVIINHQDVSKENADEIRRGVVSDVWYNPVINWFECAGVIWDEAAQNLITDKGWSVSCSYDVKLADDAGGTENNIPYDIEFLDGVFTHLAIVDNPRYERANIVFNSKTVVKNDANFEAKHPRDEQGRFTDIPSDSNGYSIKLKKSNKISLNMAKALQKGFYPEEQVSITLPKNTKEGKKLNRLFEENKSFKKNYKLVYEHDDGQAFYDWDKKDFVKSELRYFDTKEELDAALEKLKNDPKFKGVITQKEVEEWHHISGGGKNRLIDINALKKLGFSVDTSTANKEFVLNSREIMAQNNKENTDMALLDELKKLITKVENDKGEDMDKEKVENEKVDKRDIIRQIMAIAGKHEDNEDVRTIAKLAEKLAYDKSEAGTADNKKAKNEKEDEPKDDKPADNSKVKNESEEDNKKYDDLKKDIKEDVENKCKNSVENSKNGGYFDKMNEIYNSANELKEESLYISREQKLKNAETYFAK